MNGRLIFWTLSIVLAVAAPELAIRLAMLMAVLIGGVLALMLAGALLFPPPRR
ncbi:hypothetical protein D9M70_580320 [compost metagenome]